MANRLRLITPNVILPAAMLDGYEDAERMRTILTVLLLAYTAGCATYETAPVMGQSERARANWQISFKPQYVALRQKPLTMPDEYAAEPDRIKAEVLQYGFITGWDYVISGCGATLAGPPIQIMDDQELSDAYMQGYRTGMSNAVTAVKSYFQEKKSSQQAPPFYGAPRQQ